MRNTLLALTLGLASVDGAIAQPVPLSLDNIGGTPVPAHYVKLEGSGMEVVRDILKDAQARCLRFMGVRVEIPSDSERVDKVTEESYYTATHLITYTRYKTFQITPECASIWVDGTPKLVVTHSGGVCDIKLEARVAIGDGCDPSGRSSVGRISSDANVPGEDLGNDGAMNCAQRAVEAAGLRRVRCIRTRPEPWASLTYGAAGPRNPGLVLADRLTSLRDGKVVQDLKAVEVRENITVGSDMLDLAHTQGFTVLSMPQKKRNR